MTALSALPPSVESAAKVRFEPQTAGCSAAVEGSFVPKGDIRAILGLDKTPRLVGLDSGQ
jgi:hypothetical protein